MQILSKKWGYIHAPREKKQKQKCIAWPGFLHMSHFWFKTWEVSMEDDGGEGHQRIMMVE